MLIIHFCLGRLFLDTIVAKYFWLMHHFLRFRSCLHLLLYLHLNHCPMVLISRACSECCSLFSICLCFYFMYLIYGWMCDFFPFLPLFWFFIFNLLYSEIKFPEYPFFSIHSSNGWTSCWKYFLVVWTRPMVGRAIE